MLRKSFTLILLLLLLIPSLSGYTEETCEVYCEKQCAEQECKEVNSILKPDKSCECIIPTKLPFPYFLLIFLIVGNILIFTYMSQHHISNKLIYIGIVLTVIGLIFMFTPVISDFFHLEKIDPVLKSSSLMNLKNYCNIPLVSDIVGIMETPYRTGCNNINMGFWFDSILIIIGVMMIVIGLTRLEQNKKK